jgi:hypothetical protein
MCLIDDHPEKRAVDESDEISILNETKRHKRDKNINHFSGSQFFVEIRFSPSSVLRAAFAVLTVKHSLRNILLNVSELGSCATTTLDAAQKVSYETLTGAVFCFFLIHENLHKKEEAAAGLPAFSFKS